MLDNILKVLALTAFLTFISILAYRVPQPSLVIVLLAAAAMAIYDFFVRQYLTRKIR